MSWVELTEWIYKEGAVAIILDCWDGGWLYIHDLGERNHLIYAIKQGLRNATKHYGMNLIPDSFEYMSFILHEIIKNGCEQVRISVLEETWDDFGKKFDLFCECDLICVCDFWKRILDLIGNKDIFAGEGNILLIIYNENVVIKDRDGNYILKKTSLKDFINWKYGE